jgi:hypothetical protein
VVTKHAELNTSLIVILYFAAALLNHVPTS